MKPLTIFNQIETFFNYVSFIVLMVKIYIYIYIKTHNIGYFYVVITFNSLANEILF